MKRVSFGNLAILAAVVSIMLSMVVMAPGCSGLQASRELSMKIDANAALGTANMATVVALSMPLDQAKAEIVNNAARFQSYADAKTVNYFAFLFGGKAMWCNGVYAPLIDNYAVLAQESAKRLNLYDQASANALLQREYAGLQKIKNAKDGVK